MNLVKRSSGTDDDKRVAEPGKNDWEPVVDCTDPGAVDRREDRAVCLHDTLQSNRN